MNRDEKVIAAMVIFALLVVGVLSIYLVSWS